MDSETTFEAGTGSGANQSVRAQAVRGDVSPRSHGRGAGREPVLGVYGICVVCHEKTPMARLVAVPATSLCLSCAQKEQRWAFA